MNIVSNCYYTVFSEDGRAQCRESISKIYTFRDHRKVLFVVNLLIALAGLALAMFCGWLSVTMYDETYFTAYTGWLGLSFMGVMLTIVCIIGMRGAHLVSLDLLLTYFWGITVFIGPLMLGIVACMDFYTYMSVWFRHTWELPPFQGLHPLFCVKYANGDPDAIPKCKAPLVGTDAWCMREFDGATNCKQIRENAIQEAVLWSENITLIQGIICISDIVLIGWCLFLCYRIMREQVIVKSMNDVINYLLLLPIAACTGMAYYMWWLREFDVEDLQYSLIADIFAYVSGAQFFVLPLGIIAGKFKSRVALGVYIFLVILIIGALGTNGAFALTFSGILEGGLVEIPARVTDLLACGKQLTGCSGCDNTKPTCPEWTTKEILDLLVLDLRISGIIAFVSAIYLLGALIVSFIVLRSLKYYKTDYIGFGKIVYDEEANEATNNNNSTSTSNGKYNSHSHDDFTVSSDGVRASASGSIDINDERLFPNSGNTTTTRRDTLFGMENNAIDVRDDTSQGIELGDFTNRSSSFSNNNSNSHTTLDFKNKDRHQSIKDVGGTFISLDVNVNDPLNGGLGSRGVTPSPGPALTNDPLKMINTRNSTSNSNTNENDSVRNSISFSGIAAYVDSSDEGSEIYFDEVDASDLNGTTIKSAPSP